MRCVQVEQGTSEWLHCRAGKVTASRICDAMAMLKRGGESAARGNYRADLVAERLTGFSEDHYVSPEMMHGTEMEPFARASYEIQTGESVDQVGFVLHPTLDFTGGSPDGLVGTDGLIEIKAPKTTTHIRWILDGKVPEEHQAQMLWNMVCCERKWADFVSFDPRLPEGLRLFVVRMERDDARIAEMEEAVMQFNSEVEELASFLSGKIVQPPPRPVDTRSDYEQLMAMIDAQEVTP